MFASLSSFSKLAKSWSILTFFDDLSTEFMSFAIPRPWHEFSSRNTFKLKREISKNCNFRIQEVLDFSIEKTKKNSKKGKNEKKNFSWNFLKAKPLIWRFDHNQSWNSQKTSLFLKNIGEKHLEGLSEFLSLQISDFAVGLSWFSMDSNSEPWESPWKG